MRLPSVLRVIAVGAVSASTQASPTIASMNIDVDENTTNGTLVGQVIATNGASNQQFQIEVGTLDTKKWKTAGDEFESVSFSTSFSEAPIVFTQVQSYGEYTVPYYWDTYSSTGWQYKEGYEVLVRTRQQNTTATSFETVIETDLRVGGGSVVEEIGNREDSETIGWMAISGEANGIWSELPFESKLTPEEVTKSNSNYAFSGLFYETPNFIGNIATTNDSDRSGLGLNRLRKQDVRVYIDELDDEGHDAEAVSMLAIQGTGLLYDASGRVIGEVGSYSTEDRGRSNADTISLSRTYSDPVIFIHTYGTDEDIYDATWRFTNISNNSFSGYLHGDRENLFTSEFDGLDIQYVVMERGSWTVSYQSYTYEISAGNDSGAFAIDAATGEITVADSSQLDFESGMTEFSLTVSVTDGTGESNTAEVAIALNDVSDSLNTEAHILTGSNADDQLGWATSPGGDINGDGYDDFILAAHRHDVNGSNSGRVYVVFGNGDGDLPSISDIDAGSGGFYINGESAGDQAGFSIAGGGDVNGDGLADIAIGAPYASPYGDGSGKAYVVFGKNNTDPVELSVISADDNNEGFVMNGSTQRDDVGGSIVLGDVNGDRLADITIGEIHRTTANPGIGISSTSHTDKNYSYTVFGKQDGLSVNLSELAADDDNRGFVIDANNRSKSEAFMFGSVVSPVGDFNSDGRDDFLVNKGILSDTMNTLVFGRVEGTSLLLSEADDDSNGIAINSEDGTYYLTFSTDGSDVRPIPNFVSGRAGDINADGIEDIVLYLADTDCCADITNQRAYVVFGSAGIKTDINLEDIAQGNGGFIIENDAPKVDWGGSSYLLNIGSVSGAGDINGDGFDDLMIGDLYSNNNNGRAYIVYGKSGTDPVNLSDVVNGVGGYHAVGAGSERLGHWLSQAGDVNGDGITDMLFGAHLSDPTSGNNAGKVYVYISKGEAITQWGSTGDDVLNLSGQIQASNVSGMTGNDYITKSIFADVIFAGPGDDTITLNDTNIARIDGGQGTDTIVLTGANQTLSIASRASLVRSIEVFDINGTGANTLAFNKNVSGKQSVTIRGGSDDSVISTNQTWVDNELIETIDGIDYHVYSSGFALMYLQVGVNITVNADPTVEAASFSIDEYSKGGTIIGTVSADANDAGDSVQFSISAGNESGVFEIDQNTGVLSLSGSLGQLDYEDGANYGLSIEVVDLYGARDEALVTVNVNNLEDLSYSMTIDAGGSGSIWGDDFLVELFSQEIQEGEEVSTNLPGSIDLPMFTLNASGEIGMKTELNTNGGSVEAVLPMTYEVSFPDEVEAGVAFELTSSLSMNAGAKMDVSSPEFSLVGTAWLKNYSLGVEAKFPTLLDDLSFVDTNMSGTYAEEVMTIESDSESESTIANEDDEFLFEAVIDLPEWVVQSLDTPDKWGYFQKSTSGSAERCIDDFFGYAGEDLSARWEYYLFEQSLNATASLYQDFRLELQPSASITLEDGTVIEFDPREKVLITPEHSHDINGDGVIEATINVTPNPMFRNDSELKASLSMPTKAAYLNYNIQEAICGYNNIILYQNAGLVYEKDSEGPLLDIDLFEAHISTSPFGGQTDFIEDIIEFNLNSASYTQEVRFDLCDSSKSACATPAINDTDSDGMSDEWETLHGLDPSDPSDAELDGDSDNYTNLEEYEANSDPGDPYDIPVYPPEALVTNQSILATPVGRVIQLDGSATTNADSYAWEQISGPAVELMDETTDTPSFVLPKISVSEDLVFQLTASNSEADDTALLTIEVDLAPVADAGTDQPSGNDVINPGDLVTLSASNSSDDKFSASSLSYSWKETTSSGVSLSDTSAVSPSFYAPYLTDTGGALIFEVSVSDGLNEATTDSVIINIDAGAPIADAGPDMANIMEGDEVCLDASNSTDVGGGSISSYAWIQSFGTDVALSDTSAEKPCFTWPTETSTIGFELTVSDNDGLMASDSVVLSAAEVVVPVCHAGTDRAFPEGDVVTLDGSHSSIETGSIDYLWSQKSGNDVTLAEAQTQSTTFTAPDVDAGGETLVFTLRCTSNSGAVNEDDVIVTIGDGDAPEADAGVDQSVNELEEVCLDGSGSSDPDGDELNYKWSQTASSSGDSVTLQDPIDAETCFVAPATDDTDGISLTFSLEVTEAEGALSDTDEVIVNVSRINQAPILSPIENMAGEEGSLLVLSIEASDADNDDISYAWRQDSGSEGIFAQTDLSTVEFTLPYVDEGGETIEITVAVSDGDLTNTWTFSIEVSDGASTPTVTAALNELVQTAYDADTEEMIVLSLNLVADQAGSELYELTLSADGDLNEVEDLSLVRVYHDANADGALQEDETLLSQGAYETDNGSLTLVFLKAQALAQGNNHFLVIYQMASKPVTTLSNKISIKE